MKIKKKLSLFIIIALIVAIAVIVTYYSGIFVPNYLKQGNFETSVIERGNVVSAINASGVVESENEVLILSPATSIIKTILKEPGSSVKAGETILILDKEQVQSDIERLSDELEVKKNNLEKNRLNAQGTRLDLGYNEEVKKLKISSLKSQLADQKQLLEVGGISPARLEQTKQEITLAEKDLQTLIEKNSIRLKQLAADEKGLLLQINMDEKVLKEKMELLNKLTVRAPSSGIILAINGHEGEKVNSDRMLVRMSDLTTFKIIGSVEEQNAKQIKTGKQVLVTIDDETLEGRIGNITPLVENSKIQFNVHLKNSNHPKLIANQQVQIKIINNSKQNVLRVKKLPEFEKSGSYKVFVIDGNEAIKKEINIGLIGYDSCEVVSGLNEGEVIISDGANFYRHLNEIEIKN
ncbi:HlyD family efflux transporter periplasmic adaptor subunit [Maribellus comscasis]|uniref:HlyD family efflux transporter periplasmic adaptor subunit n=1 Tax=Maribellus comscasis TaxID=2681766 RepID=A0A6I6JPG6_9BACT|nr:HlyD family efflux transporter periplasmic adaptor subunit [Maribellus comscasis]QGY44866.1 HlyD family efflux transporter periplasmic adaptor subunit [Maribellus comscasis]